MGNHLKSRSTTTAQVSTPAVAVEDAVSGTSGYLTENQVELSISLGRKLCLPGNVTDSKKYHYLIAEMIALDIETLSIIERVGFKRLLEQVIPCFESPSRTYILQKIVPDIGRRIRGKIKTNISKAVAVSFTADLLICKYNSLYYLNITAHWLSPEFQLQQGVLAVQPVLGTHSGKNIVKEVNAIAPIWGIDQNKIHLLVYDGPYRVKGARVAKYHTAKCFIHSLQKVVDKAVKVQADVIEMIATGRGVVSHFNNSMEAQARLLGIQKRLNLPLCDFIQDINNRWNSTFYTVESLLEQKRAIYLFIDENGTVSNLTTQQWELMEQCINLLKPFEEIMKIASSRVFCISEVIPHVAALKKYLDKEETARRTPALSQMRASLKSELESCFKSLGEDPNYLVATFLDPRFKSDYLGDLETVKTRIKILIDHKKITCDAASDNNSSSSATPAKQRKIDNTRSIITREARDTFWNCFNEVLTEKSKPHNQEINPVADEIDYYLKTLRIDSNHDPLNWWSVNAIHYPHLAKIARVYLSAPGTAVSRENMFSEPGIAYEDKRNRLLAFHSEHVVFIHYNLPLINFKY